MRLLESARFSQMPIVAITPRKRSEVEGEAKAERIEAQAQMKAEAKAKLMQVLGNTDNYGDGDI